MTKRFFGFADNDQVTVTARQGGVTRGPLTVSAWRQAAMADFGDMTINANYAPGTPAPASIWFNVDVGTVPGLPPRQNGDVSASAAYDEYDQPFHEMEFEWSFGDAGDWQYTERHPSALYRSRDYGHGKVINHVFSTPGDKTIRCTAYLMGRDGSGNLTRTLVARKTITFASGGDHPSIPSVEEAFPLAQRIYFDPAAPLSDQASMDVYYGADSNLPAGANTPGSLNLNSNSLYRVMEWASNQPNPVAVFFKRGTLINWDGATPPPQSNPNLYLGTYGTGARPIVRTTAGGSLFTVGPNQWPQAANGGFIILDGLELLGEWSAYDESGAGAQQSLFGGEGIRHHLVHDCILRDAGSPVNFGLNSGQSAALGERSMVVCDTQITGWREYAIMVTGGAVESFYQNVSVLGSRIAHRPDSAMGLNGKAGDQNEHGPMRVENAHTILVRGSDLYSRQDWGSDVQPCIRLNTLSPQQWGLAAGHVVIYGNVFEGGSVMVLSDSAGGTDDPPGAIICPPGFGAGDAQCRGHTWPINTLAKHNLCLGSFSVSGAINLRRSCSSIIENVCVRPDVLRWKAVNADDNRGGDWNIGLTEVTSPDYSNNGWVSGMNDEVVQNPVRVIGNTTIDLKATTRAADELNNATGPGLAGISSLYVGYEDVRDNVLYAPNYTDTPADLANWVPYGPPIPPRETYGVRHDGSIGAGRTASMTDNVGNNGVFDEDTSYATPAMALQLYAPGATAAVARAASQSMSARDFFGVERIAGQPASQGAMEPV